MAPALLSLRRSRLHLTSLEAARAVSGRYPRRASKGTRKTTRGRRDGRAAEEARAHGCVARRGPLPATRRFGA